MSDMPEVVWIDEDPANGFSFATSNQEDVCDQPYVRKDLCDDLTKQNERLRSRGIEDMQFEIADITKQLADMEKGREGVLRLYNQTLGEMQQKNDDLTKQLSAITGWREYDWPEGFDRRTADLMVENMKRVVEQDSEVTG